MYKIDIYDNDLDELTSLIVFDLDELKKTIDYIILHSETLELVSVYQEDSYIGFQSFEECREENKFKNGMQEM